MATKQVTKIGVLSLGKILGVLYAIMGLIFGALITLMSLGAGSLMGERGAFAGMLFGVGAIIAVPIFYGIMGFIGGITMALLYNLTTELIGGLEIEVE
jgi:hypothetical protein